MRQRAFKSLADAVEVYYEELRHFIRQRTGSAAAAEEVVQDTWIRASSTVAELHDNPRAYLYRMAANLSIDHLRRERAAHRFTNAHLSKEDDEQALELLACPSPSPVERVISQQEMAALNAAVQDLPEKCREVFLLYRGRGLTMSQIASVLSISEKTVEKHIARAMVYCRKCLREVGREV